MLGGCLINLVWLIVFWIIASINIPLAIILLVLFLLCTGGKGGYLE